MNNMTYPPRNKENDKDRIGEAMSEDNLDAGQVPTVDNAPEKEAPGDAADKMMHSH